MGARVVIAYASRFGSTRTLVGRVAEGLLETGMSVELLDVAADPRPPPEASLVVASAIIWESPLPAMRDWIALHRARVRERVVAAGVVCGRAGLEANGGGAYSRAFAKRAGREGIFEFALGGALPPRDRLRAWESAALAAAGAVLGHSFARLRLDEGGAFAVGTEIGRALLGGARTTLESRGTSP